MQLLRANDYKHIFEPLIDKKVSIFPAIGNYGDHLIWEGCDYLLSHFSIDVTNIQECDIILIQGGGNLGNFYPEVTKSRLELNKLNKEIIVLPQSLTSEINFKIIYKRAFQ